jgi:hypothetical protein
MGFPLKLTNSISAKNGAVVDLKSQKNKWYYFTSNNKVNVGAQFGVTHQEITFDQGNYFGFTIL